MVIVNLDINVRDINIKKGLKYSNDFTFVGLSYLKKDICIQTPKLYSKYGINDKYDKSSINLSLQNIENDISVKKLKFNLDLIYNYIRRKYYNYNVVKYLKDLDFRLKIKEDCKIFDVRQNVIDTIMGNTYGNYIIYLQGFWIIDKDIYFQWYALQAKIDLPLYLDNYAFIDETKETKSVPKSIPKPPPLPIFKKTQNKIVIHKQNEQNNIKIAKKGDVPSLDDICLALSRLKAINIK